MWCIHWALSRDYWNTPKCPSFCYRGNTGLVGFPAWCNVAAVGFLLFDSYMRTKDPVLPDERLRLYLVKLHMKINLI